MFKPRSAHRPALATRPRRLLGVTAVLVGAAAVAGLTGCSALEIREEMCMSTEYPVLAVNSSGSDCVPKGEEPGEGYARYPEGKVPEVVGDKWDVYWDTRTLDEDGNIVKLPEAH
ncbi:SCO0607 family lipoprotein [Streptomyces sp. NPDC058739]|uniref:SCO0607 family lipoprotein n=1 Tax=Streptomyces sp. NPDC058739 TaxID=3346618 RepID=UPI0036CDA9FF